MSIKARVAKSLLRADAVGRGNLRTREAWLREALGSIPSGSRILDAGAGELKYKSFCQHLDYVSQDFGQYDGVGNSVGFQTGTWDNSRLDIVSDILNIPVPAHSFDAIMCIEVFEHIPQPIDAIGEFSRILRPGGTLVLTAPVCSLTHFAPYYFYNGFSRYFYEAALGKHSFRVVEISSNGNYFEYIAQELRRLPEVSKSWADHKMRLRETFLIKRLLKILQQLTRSDMGSDELLCLGLHIKAKKL